MGQLETSTWALVLAGGDGTRLKPLTTQITGDARPKQFCPIVDGETLLEITRRRVDLITRYDHQVVVVSRLWNSFVMVGWTSTFLGMFRTALPGLLAAFEPLRSVVGTPAETEEAERLYRVIPDVNFSDRVLSVAVERLVALRVKGIEWSDWGNVDRVMKSLARARRRPAWFERVELASTA